jgi:hypothetical protein
MIHLYTTLLSSRRLRIAALTVAALVGACWVSTIVRMCLLCTPFAYIWDKYHQGWKLHQPPCFVDQYLRHRLGSRFCHSRYADSRVVAATAACDEEACLGWRLLFWPRVRQLLLIVFGDISNIGMIVSVL